MGVDVKGWAVPEEAQQLFVLAAMVGRSNTRPSPGLLPGTLQGAGALQVELARVGSSSDERQICLTVARRAQRYGCSQDRLTGTRQVIGGGSFLPPRRMRLA